MLLGGSCFIKKKGRAMDVQTLPSYLDRKQTDYYLTAAKELLERRSTAQPMAYVHSFGCQQNQSDTEKIMGMLSAMGYGFTPTPENADLVLFNTCAIRENAEVKVFGNIGAVKQYKTLRPDMVVCVCGCMVQQKHIVEKLQKSYRFVDIIFGTHVLASFPELLYQKLSGQKNKLTDVREISDDIVEGLPVRREDGIRAWLPIMYGCDNFCTYCVVPYVRGRERSRKPEDILDEVRSLAAEGYKEITLLGQNVNSYGKGLKPSINFAGLLRQIAAVPGDFRVRFMTSHPRDCTHELIDTIADCEKLCIGIHLPVQSGSDRVLTVMNRHYDTAHYMELVEYARKQIPGVMFTSDIIVGFPGETREEFEETLALIRQVRFEKLFTFIFSPRTGTRAAKMEDPVPYRTKSDWLREILELQTEIVYDLYQEMLGKSYSVLAEGESRSKPGVLIGHTDTNVLMEFPGDPSLIGRFVSVKAVRATKTAVIGELA